MDFGQHNITRKVLVALMDFLSKIQIEKYGSVENGYVTRKSIKVPIQFASRDKWLEVFSSSSARRAMDPEIRDKNPVEMQWILPRIGVQMSVMSYDAMRKLVKTQRVTDIVSDNTGSFSYTPTPYNLDVDVYVVSKTLDENLQIMEQILPNFSPGMSLDIKTFGDEPQSTSFILSSVTQDIPMDISENDERLITFIYTFNIKINYFMPKKTFGYIQQYFTPITIGSLPASAAPNLYNFNSNIFKKFDGTEWNDIFSIPTNFISDNGYPSDSVTTDYYLDVISNRLYKKINDVWVVIGSLPSIAADHTNTTLSVLSSLPVSGNSGSFILNSTDRKLYQYVNDNWVSLVTFSASGSIFEGSSVPASGSLNDLFVDSKGTIYQFTTNGWLVIYTTGIVVYPRHLPLIYNIKSNTYHGIDYIEVDQKWIESNKRIESKFNKYETTSLTPNPYI